MYWIETVKTAYTINLESRNKCAAMIDRIVKEDPSYWPHGCDLAGFNDLYMVRKAADNEPVGFVGWQLRQEKMARVGYYAIGILPEYRKQGFAKDAVAGLLEKCASLVDTVRAFIMPHNGPSHALAESLGVPVIHKMATKAAAKAIAPLWQRLLPSVATGVGTAGLWDAKMHPDKGYGLDQWDKNRASDFLLNGVFGGVGGGLIQKSFDPAMAAHSGKLLTLGASTAMTGPIVKNVGIRAPAWLDSVTKKNLADASKGPSMDPKALAMIVGGGAIAGAGLMGANMLRKAMLNSAASRQQGRVKVTLPTKAEGDAETSVDLPASDMNISATLMSAMGRDTRRRLREESSQRKWKRNASGRLLTNGTPLRDVEVLDGAPDEKAAYLNLLTS